MCVYVRHKIENILQSWLDDKSRIRECFESIPAQRAREYKKYSYTIVRPGGRGHDYDKDDGIEIDFLLRYNGQCTLVECKATTGNAKSIRTVLNHPEKYHISSALKLGDYNIGRKDQLLTMPMYMTFLLTAY